MRKILFPITFCLVLSACSSTPNRSVEVPVAKEERDYIVKERNPDPAPDWVRDFSKWKREREGKQYQYFLGESGDVNDRIAGCDIATLAAKRRIAQQVAEFITNKIAANKQGQLAIDPNESQDPGMRRAFEDQIAGKSMAFLSGTKEYGTFWELRDYSKVNGHKRVFNCSVLVMISDRDLQQALQRSSTRAPEVVEDTEAKAAVKEALKNIDQDFKAYSSRTN